MPILGRGESSSCTSTTKLDIFIKQGSTNTLIDVESLEFQIFDLEDELNPVQVFPVSGRQTVDLNDCPTGSRLGTGHYVAPYTVGATQKLGPYEIRWFFRQILSLAEQSFSEQFTVLESSPSTGDGVTVADIKKRFPQFAGLDDVYIECLIAEAVRLGPCESGCIGDAYDDAIKYLVAHLIESTGSRAGSGTKRVKAGQAEVEYHQISENASQAFASLGTTGYGRLYQELIYSQCGGGFRLIC